MKKIILFLLLSVSVLFSADEDYNWKIASIKYTGDGTSNRTVTDTDTIDFTPNFAIIINLGKNTEGYLTDTLMANNQAGEFDGSNSGMDSLLYGGVKLVSTYLNVSNDIYALICMKLDSTHFEEGTYVGNATENRVITTSTQRNIFWTHRFGGSDYGPAADISDFDANHGFIMHYNYGGFKPEIYQLADTGVVIGDYSNVNENTIPYRWCAWTDEESAIEQDSIFYKSSSGDTLINMGFEPCLIIAKINQSVTHRTFFKTKYHHDDSCSTNKVNEDMVTGAIKAISANGFTLGDYYSGDRYWHIMAWGEGSEAAASATTRKRSQIIISR
jgi:hypothetical protein